MPIEVAAPDKILNAKRERLKYGGKGEPEHVGGFKQNDPKSFTPGLWT